MTEPAPVTMPMFPLGTVLVPGAHLPLQLFEPRYLALLEAERADWWSSDNFDTWKNLYVSEYVRGFYVPVSDPRLGDDGRGAVLLLRPLEIGGRVPGGDVDQVGCVRASAQARLVLVNFLEPEPGETDLHHELPIGALLHLTNIGTLFAFVIVCGAVLIMRRTVCWETR